MQSSSAVDQLIKEAGCRGNCWKIRRNVRSWTWSFSSCIEGVLVWHLIGSFSLVLLSCSSQSSYSGLRTQDNRRCRTLSLSHWFKEPSQGLEVCSVLLSRKYFSHFTICYGVVTFVSNSIYGPQQSSLTITPPSLCLADGKHTCK